VTSILPISVRRTVLRMKSSSSEELMIVLNSNNGSRSDVCLRSIDGNCKLERFVATSLEQKMCLIDTLSVVLRSAFPDENYILLYP
jgi:hypothetical protein